jgi:ABC-type transport system involved in multi-copper enzyme maturation permease subunit
LTGAILRREIVVPSRKLHTFLVRGGYSLLLAATFGMVFLIHFLSAIPAQGQSGTSIRMVAESGQRLFESLVVINISACLLFTPAYVASAISQEKDQRTMQDLLLTTMSPTEIVLSKLLGRLGQVLLVLVAGLPLVSIGSLLGGVSGSMQLALAAMTFNWLMTAGSFTLLISVLVKRTRDAILASYSLGLMILIGATALRLLAPPPWLFAITILDAFNPFRIVWIATAGADAVTVWQIIGETTLVLGTFSMMAILLAIVLLRPLGVRQLAVGAPRRGWVMRRRTTQLSDERPMLWKERCFPPAGTITRFAHFSGFLGAVVMAVLLGVWIYFWFADPLPEFDGAVWFVVVKGLTWPIYLSLLLTSSSAFAGERERATWDAILTSPLDGREIVWGKLAGSLWDVRWWLAAISLGFVIVLLQAIDEPELTSFWGTAGTSRAARVPRALALIVTGSLAGMPGIIGLAGNIAFLLGVGLRTSLGSKTSGKALAITLMIWIASGIVFWIGLYIVIAVAALAVFAMFRGNSPDWLNGLLPTLGTAIFWLAPPFIGLFWGGIGLWLIRHTIRQFDDLATRLKHREVVPRS